MSEALPVISLAGAEWNNGQHEGLHSDEILARS
jgi:hypothetical protein